MPELPVAIMGEWKLCGTGAGGWVGFDARRLRRLRPHEREEVSPVFKLLDRVGHQCGQSLTILIPGSMFYVFERVAEVLA